VSQTSQPKTSLSKEEIIAALRKCAEKLGHVPSLPEFHRLSGVALRNLRRLFGTYTQTLSAAGLERRGPGSPVPMDALFTGWAEVVRRLGKIPTVREYEQHSKYSARPLLTRFKSWNNLSLGLLLYAQENRLEDRWKDVLDVVRAQRKEKPSVRMANASSAFYSAPILRTDRPVFGPSLTPLPMAHAPTNELGVIFLFGLLAAELGFVVLRLQPEFPDCKAMRQIDEKRWQEVWIEFEFESRNFLAHMHNPEGCDLIVCWEHNWPECPLEVLELKTALSRKSTQQSAASIQPPWR